MLWGHEASTYLCVGSLGFQGSSQNNKITMNVNVRPQLFNQEALKKNTYKIMKKHNPTLVVNLPIAYSTTSPRNNPPRGCATLQEKKPRQELKVSLSQMRASYVMI
jgi:hypothetical protein